jgi:dTDP-4-dehydrorhamnose reductase
MRIALFGANGQVGREVLRRAPSFGADILPVDRARCDFADRRADFASVIGEGCEAVINAAAYTAVDKAESEPQVAALVNADAPGRLARLCARRGMPLVSFSTDYVFAGEGNRPYREDDPTGPLNVYGATKLEGEQAIAASGAKYAILRLSWVFSSHGTNFVKTMLRLGREGAAVRVVADQRGKPTPARAAAEAAILAAKGLAKGDLAPGLYHFAGDRETNWADFAAEIFRRAKLPAQVVRITTAERKTPARRPNYSVLDTAKYEAAFAARPPSWSAALDETLAELAAEENAG